MRGTGKTGKRKGSWESWVLREGLHYKMQSPEKLRSEQPCEGADGWGQESSRQKDSRSKGPVAGWRNGEKAGVAGVS